MVKPPKGGFKMDTNLKCPAFSGSRNKAVILAILIEIGILIGLSPIFEPTKGAEVSLVEVEIEEIPEGLEGRLILLQENSLLPISNPSDPENQIKGQIRVIVTGYSSTEDQTDSDPFITASGTWVRDGVIANNYLPIGTKIRIPEIYGEKIFVVEDRMSWTRGNYQIDIWFSSYREAKNFGAKSTYIEILEG